MKRIGILTFHRAINYGACLQAYALKKYIKDQGNECDIIDYHCPAIEDFYNRVFLWEDSFKTKIKKVLTWSIQKKRNIRFKQFIEKNLLDAKFGDGYNKNNISETNELYDSFITGSDQVWNNEYNRGIDPVFYLDFAPQHAKKIAYAASIGQNSLSDIEKESMRSALKCYACLTVREDLAKAQLTELGYDSTQVLDPTLLLSKEEWLSVFKKSSFIKVEPFLLVYSVEWNNDDLIMKLAKDIASLRGLKIYVYSTSWNVKSVKCDKRFVFGTPDLFISLFSKADYVIVSSFHGTAFSINFNKQFLAVLPDKYSSRSVSILNKFNLSRRMYNGETAINDIDYTPVNAILSTERNKSMSILAKMVN